MDDDSMSSDWADGLGTGSVYTPRTTFHSVYMVGTNPVNSYEKDLQYDYACQQVYLLRGVDLQGQPALGKCRAEALAFGFISARPRGVKRSSSLICFQVIPRNGGRRVPLALWMAWPQSGYPGQQPSVTCFSRERQSCSSRTRICKLVGRVRHDDPGEMKAWSEY